ncbi:MAG: hypothetical protein HZB39_02695 [Planctomycetes bacterium]|nr:hypothetical protein [Planctomycetota bacterium]
MKTFPFVLALVVTGIVPLLPDAAPLRAQGRVWPAPYATAPGESAMDTPFTITSFDASQGSRCATLIRAATLPFGVGSVLNAIAFRRDAVRPDTYATRSGAYEIYIGSVNDAATHGPGMRGIWLQQPVRAGAGNLSLPLAVPPSGGTAPFTIVAPFQFAWTWPGGDMAYDIVFTGSPGTPWRRDAAYRTPRVDAQGWSIGTGCTSSSGFIPQPWLDPDTAVPGGTLALRVQGAPLPAGGVAIMMLGLPRGFGVPLDPIGFPVGCKTHVGAFYTLGVPTGAPSRLYAQAIASVPIPATPTLAGAVLATEWVILDLALGTALPFAISDGFAFQIGTGATLPNYGRSIWAYGSTQIGASYSGRLAEPDYVPVTEFRGTFQ